MAVDMDPFLMQSTCQLRIVARDRVLRAGYFRCIPSKDLNQCGPGN